MEGNYQPQIDKGNTRRNNPRTRARMEEAARLEAGDTFTEDDLEEGEGVFSPPTVDERNAELKAAAIDVEEEGSLQSVLEDIKEEVLEGSASLSRPTVKMEVDRSTEGSEYRCHRFGGR